MSFEDLQIKRAFQHYMASGNTPKLKELCGKFIRHKSHDPQGWYINSQYLLSIGENNSALQSAIRAMELAPQECSVIALVGKCYLLQYDQIKALKYAQRALKLAPDTFEQCDTLGNIFSQCGEQELALELFKKAVKIQPENSNLLYNLAMSYRFLGNFELAEETFSKCISMNPADGQAVLARSSLQTQTKSSNHIGELINKLSLIVDAAPGIYYNYALAKEKEDLGLYKESFNFLQKGAGLKSKSINYDIDIDIENIETLKSALKHTETEQLVAGIEDESPIFVVGLPRTGTTLVERILSSHSQVVSIGESFAFPVELGTALAGRGDRVDIDYNKLRSGYLESIKNKVENSVRFVDKLPLNYLNIWYIAHALPKAKIIILERNPMDTCYSIYKSLFNREYLFSYDLESMAKYYLAYTRLINHWRDEMPGAFLTVNYDNLVSDFQVNVEKILDYCGLQFENNTLEFHKNTSASTTASSSQVRQEVYTSSVGNWKNYADELQLVQQILKNHNVDIS